MREAAPSADENQDLALNGLILLAHYHGIKAVYPARCYKGNVVILKNII